MQVRVLPILWTFWRWWIFYWQKLRIWLEMCWGESIYIFNGNLMAWSLPSALSAMPLVDPLFSRKVIEILNMRPTSPTKVFLNMSSWTDEFINSPRCCIVVKDVVEYLSKCNGFPVSHSKFICLLFPAETALFILMQNNSSLKLSLIILGFYPPPSNLNYLPTKLHLILILSIFCL